MDERLSQSAYARRIGCGRMYVSELKEKGVLVLDESGMVLVDATDKRMLAQTQAVEGKTIETIIALQDGATLEAPLADLSTEDLISLRSALCVSKDPEERGKEERTAGERLLDAKVKHLEAKAQMARRKAAVMDSTLIDREDLFEQLQSIMRVLTSQISRIPHRVAPKVMHIKDVAEVIRTLSSEFDICLHEIADEIESMRDP